MTKRNLPAGLPAERMKSGKAGKIIYWIATIWLALGMLSSGIVQLIRMKEETDMMTHLGYPLYFLTILGIWKILGVIAVLISKFPLLKEWAYAGFVFVMSGAVFSHLASGDGASEFFGSVLLLVLTLVSWYFRNRLSLANAVRPVNSKIVSLVNDHL